MSNEEGYKPFKVRCKTQSCGAIIASNTTEWYPVTYKQGRNYRYVSMRCPVCKNWSDKLKENLEHQRSTGDSRKNYPKARNGIAHNAHAAIVWIEEWPESELDSLDPDDSDT